RAPARLLGLLGRLRLRRRRIPRVGLARLGVSRPQLELLPLLFPLPLGARLLVEEVRDAPREEQWRREITERLVFLEPLADRFDALRIEVPIQEVDDELEIGLVLDDRPRVFSHWSRLPWAAAGEWSSCPATRSRHRGAQRGGPHRRGAH